MLATAIILLLQQPPATPTAELPVSIDRIREGLARPSRFDPPPPRAWQGIFRVRIEAWEAFEDKPWEGRSQVPLWVQPSTPLAHFEFLQSSAPEEVRGATAYPCCIAVPTSAVKDVINGGIRAVKARRAKREVERAMHAAGIR